MSKFKRFWLWLNREPKDLDKAIKESNRLAKFRFVFSLVLFFFAVALVFMFVAPLAGKIGSPELSAFESLALSCGLFVVVAIPLGLCAFQMILGLMAYDDVLHYRLRKLEKQFEAEKVD